MALLKIKSQARSVASSRYLMKESPAVAVAGQVFSEPPKKAREKAWLRVQRDLALQKRKRLAASKSFVETNYPHVAHRLAYLMTAEKALGHEISEAAFDRAYEIIYEFARMAHLYGAQLPRPYTFGTPSNGVQYEWRRGGREFHLEIIPEGKRLRYEYLLRATSRPNEARAGDLVGSFRFSPIVAEFLSWVERGWL